MSPRPTSRFSEAPPSSQLPGRSSGSGAYVLGIVAFGALIVALLLFWRHNSAAPPPPPAPPPAVSTPNAPTPAYAPPPPPVIEEPDADAGREDAGKSSAGSHQPAGPSPCEGCGKGVSNGTLEARLKSQASLAKGCYNRALRTEDISGRLTVSVSVGADGRTCSAAIANDSVGSPAISNCVASKFAGQTFPRPTQGCVVVNIPIEFKTK